MCAREREREGERESEAGGWRLASSNLFSGVDRGCYARDTYIASDDNVG